MLGKCGKVGILIEQFDMAAATSHVEFGELDPGRIERSSPTLLKRGSAFGLPDCVREITLGVKQNGTRRRGKSEVSKSLDV